MHDRPLMKITVKYSYSKDIDGEVISYKIISAVTFCLQYNFIINTEIIICKLNVRYYYGNYFSILYCHYCQDTGSYLYLLVLHFLPGITSYLYILDKILLQLNIL